MSETFETRLRKLERAAAESQTQKPAWLVLLYDEPMPDVVAPGAWIIRVPSENANSFTLEIINGKGTEQRL